MRDWKKTTGCNTTLNNVQSIGSLPKTHGELRTEVLASNNDKQDERQRRRIAGHRVLSGRGWERIEGVDNVAYICNVESERGSRGEVRDREKSVRSCSHSRFTFTFSIFLCHPLLSLPIASGFLTEALLRYLFV